MANIIKFKFNHAAISADDKVQVLSFKGHEAISTLYEFDIELLSINPDLDIDDMLEQQASLEIVLEDDTRTIQGIIQDCQAVSQLNNQTLYRVKLVPKLWELSLYHTNEVYLEMSTVDVIEQVLKEAGFTTQDYDISGLQGDYPAWPYRCQYGENHLDFISRLMERDGIYYYFIEGEVGEKVIFCDSMQAQESISKADVLYSPAASLEINSLANNVSSFINKKTRLPYKVLLKDYNDDKPSVDIKGEAVVDERAVQTSEIYVWGQNIQTPEEGEALAKVRAEELQSTKSMYLGESSVARLLVGHHFNLKGHFRSACNQEYLLVSIEHEAQNPSLLDFSSSSNESSRVYQNTFSAIPASSQYRHPQITAKPEIHGTLNAFVDAEGDGHYAELDEEGRYRITLPFDRVDRDGGKASHWIRMSQPYGGEGHGMSFPLRKGAEVLLTFIGGDPDRPVIAGTVPNASQPSVTTSENQTNSVIKTGAGNKIELEDKDGTNRIKLHTGDNTSYMHLGAPNHAGDGFVVVTKGMERKEIIGGHQSFVAAAEAPYISYNAATKSKTSIPARVDKTGSGDSQTDKSVDDHEVADAINEITAFSFSKKTFNGTMLNGSTSYFTKDEELLGKNIFNREVGNSYNWKDGNKYNYHRGVEFNYGPRHVEYYSDRNGVSSTLQNESGLIIEENADSITVVKNKTNYIITNAKSGGSDDNLDKTKLIDNARPIAPEKHLVEVIYGDKYSYQMGRNFAWADTCDYNIGTGYTENVFVTNSGSNYQINKDYSGDKDKAGTGGTGWTSITGKYVTLSESETVVEKTIGNTYEYMKGNTIGVMKGDADSYTYGNSYSYVDGDSEENVTGDSTSTVDGNTKSRYTGNVDEHFFGRTDSMYIGGTSEFKVAAGISLSFAMQQDFYFGMKSEVLLGLNSGIHVGPKIDIHTGPKLEGNLTDLKNKISELNNKATSIEVKGVDVGNIGTKLGAAGLFLMTGGLSMFA